MKRKGFTLIELLAVIVILAIIAIIATPMILGIIEKAKKGGAESSALGYIDAVEKTVATNMLDTNKTNIEDGVYEVSTLKSTTYDVKVKGEQPTEDSWVKIEKGQVIACSLKIGEYVINCNGETIKNGEIGEHPKTTYKVYSNGTAIYYNPQTNSICSESESVSTTGTKTGCMKWYTFNDNEDSSTVNMILDHNTTGIITWNKYGENLSYEDSNLSSAIQDLKTTSGWLVNPRIISAEEVAKITNNDKFTGSALGESFYLDSNSQTQTATSQGASKYAWLFDYTNSCTKAGCNVEDNNGYTNGIYNGFCTGYWTSSSISGSNRVWNVSNNGSLSTTEKQIATANGIRPVITIEKTIIVK